MSTRDTSQGPELHVGTILMPGPYLRANNTFISGIITDVVDDLWGKNYRVAMTNGNVQWKDESTIRDLWEVIT